MSDPQQTAADPAGSAFVSANAGSGKTKTLIDRTARLLLGEADPAKVLCVTYTRAAAAEMQRRLFDKLGAWSVMSDARLEAELARLTGKTGFDLAHARTLFARALETPGGLKIQTIHAFCERLLKHFPLEARVSPNFEVADDATAAALSARARTGLARRVLEGADDELSEAYARMSVALDFHTFQKMFSGFETERLGIRNWLAGKGDAAAIRAGVAALVEVPALREPADVEAEHFLPPRLDVGRYRAAAALMDQGTQTDQTKAALYRAVAVAAEGAVASPGIIEDLFYTEGELRKSMGGKVVTPAMAQWWAEEQARVDEARALTRAHRVGQDTVWVMILAAVYLDEYEAAKRARGVLDFADLVEHASKLLEDSDDAAWVLYKLDEGIEHILLDEAQDTAPLQWDIVRSLTGEFFSGDGRTSNRTLDRTLFIVGDRKQSIYSFQGARPERLDEEIDFHMTRIRGAGFMAEKVDLEHSWRSAGEVLTFVDTVFAVDHRREAIQPGGQGVIHIPTRTDGPGCIELWPPFDEPERSERTAWTAPMDQRPEDSANVRLARAIAAEVKALVDRRDGVFDKTLNEGKGARRAAGYGDVLILVRRRKALFEDILRELKRLRIPVAGADRLKLSSHIVFDDLLALARFALFPKDELNLAALLKSPFCGLDDDSLYALAFGRTTNLWTLLQRRADDRGDWQSAHAFLADVLAEARLRRPFDFYGRLLARTDGSGRSGRQRLIARLGAEAAEAIDEFHAHVLAAEQRGARDLESLAHALGRLEIEVKRDMDEGEGQVRVMTTHGAKGLEAPIVILPEMALNSDPPVSRLLAVEDGGYLWCTAKGRDCEASKAARERARERLAHEQQRLLYVGLTRARDRLILCGRKPQRGRPGPWHQAADEALAALGHPALEGSANGIRRYGAAPSPAPPATAEDRPASAAPPPWLGQAPQSDPTAPRTLTPSALGEAAKTPAISPLSGSGGLGRFRRGLVIHKLLQILPDIDPALRPETARRYLARQHDLTDPEREEMAAAAFGVLDDPRFAPVFGPGSRAELAIAGEAAGLPAGVVLSGQIDRLVVEESRVLVVDFKTNRPAPARIEEADPAYILQMASYVAGLREAFPGRAVEAALVWTDGPLLMPIPENLVSRALAELGRPS